MHNTQITDAIWFTRAAPYSQTSPFLVENGHIIVSDPLFWLKNGHIRLKPPLKQSNGGYIAIEPLNIWPFSAINKVDMWCSVVFSKIIYGRKRPYRRKIKKIIKQTWKKINLFDPSRPYRILNICDNIASKTKIKVSNSKKVY